MKENLYDYVQAELRKRRLAVRMMLASMYKNTKPFGMEKKMTPDEVLADYDSKTPDDMYQMMQEKGRQATNQYIFSMEQMKQKKQGVV